MHLNTDLPYPIVVGESVRTPLRDFLRERGSRWIVLADENLTGYATELTSGVARRGAILSFRLGERRKRLETVERVLEAMFAAGCDRETTVVGVGGGIASDLFGLACALYMRGVSYVHVATSLVAMVDAAIGGKTAVDLRAGKNLAGVFSDPAAVFCDIGALRSLPYRHLREGLAEMVKHAIIEGGETFESLETLAPHPFYKWPWETIVRDSIAVKTMVVRDDRLERGARERLNLGHTFAHAIELASKYTVSHGAAVAVGLRAAGLLALRAGRFSKEEHLRVLTLLALLRLPMQTAQDPRAIFDAMGADKKRRGGRLRFVLPNAVGDVGYGVEVSNASVKAVLSQCAREPGASEFR